MKRGVSGRYETTAAGGERVKAFVPTPLPPKPALDLGGPLQPLQEQSTLALGRLDALSSLLPDPSLFLYAYVRKEAVLSSRIEGTQSSLSDLLLFELDEAPGVPLDDVVEVSNYVAALNHGLERLRGGFPLSSRLIREIHGVLLSRGRGSGKEPGEFRRSQNWIGGTRPGNCDASCRRRTTLVAGTHGVARAIPARQGATGLPSLGARRPRARRSSRRSTRSSTATAGWADLLITLHAVPRGRLARAAALPEPLLQAASAELLRAPRSRSEAPVTGRRGWRSSSKESARPRRAPSQRRSASRSSVPADRRTHPPGRPACGIDAARVRRPQGASHRIAERRGPLFGPYVSDGGDDDGGPGVAGHRPRTDRQAT